MCVFVCAYVRERETPLNVQERVCVCECSKESARVGVQDVREKKRDREKDI